MSLEYLESRCVLTGTPVISEFMASNDGVFLDGDGNDSDWIEVHNPSNQAVNLAGWHLTDDASNLDKWTFPSQPQSMLDPNEYLIVFASGQTTEDYIDPAGYLHADFRLAAGGEYLGLTDPNEMIVSQYAPAYPPQITDVSYGFTAEMETLVGAAQSTSALVPTSGDLDSGSSAGSVWTMLGFDDAGWPSSGGGVGVGYDAGQPNAAGPAAGTLLIDGLIGNDLTDPEEDGLLDVVIDAGGAAGSPANETPLQALDGTTSTKWLSFFPEGTYYEVQFTDGQPRVVDNYTITSGNDAPDRDPYSWTLSGSNDGISYTVIDTRVTQDFASRFETRLYEFVNADAYEYYRFDFQTEFGVTGQNEPVAIQMAEIELHSSQQLNYDSLISLDIEDAWNAWQSSVYQRVEFNVLDPAALGALTLNMRYDDGFVAFLNGTKVASANSPAFATWQSWATDLRDDADAIVPRAFDASAHADLLTAGTNVLAIHALNVSDASSDLLAIPELTAVSLNSGTADAVFYQTPTPGAANNDGQQGFVADVELSAQRGFYDVALVLTMITETDGAQIYYTTNGDDPTPENGTLFNSPIVISETTAVKAAAFKPDYYDSPVVTHSYIFVNDVVSQDYQATLNAGFPASWGGVSPDYGMDPDVIGHFDPSGNSTGGDLFGGAYAATIQDSLTAIPTLSIVMDVDDLFGTSGIYTNSTSEGSAFERATSVELIHADGTPGFQVDAGLRIQGGAFRRHDLSKKHSFRLLFKGIYGPTKLNYPFFGDGAVSEFDTITLRMESNDGYAWDAAGSQAQYARDAFGSRSQLALGQRSTQNNRLHLYLNGVYWGLYNPVERPDASFSASYYGGAKEDWDAFSDGKTINGSSASWSTFVALAQDVSDATTADDRNAAYQRIQGNNPDGTDNPAFEQYLDVDNYVDYMLTNFYIGNVDWPHRNWYASRQRGAGSTGFKFHMWDAETALNLGSNVNTNRVNADVEAAEPYSHLRSSEEFRLRFADRAHRALFNNGPLTPGESIARYQEILAEVERGIVAESARWGDQHRSVPYTPADWVNESASVINNFLAQRTNVFANQLRSAGLYPSVAAPVFNQHGGDVSPGYRLAMTATTGDVYYTLDGSDPRGVDGQPAGRLYVAAVALRSASTVKARVLVGGEWSALNEAAFDVRGWQDPEVAVAGLAGFFMRGAVVVDSASTSRLSRLETGALDLSAENIFAVHDGAAISDYPIRDALYARYGLRPAAADSLATPDDRERLEPSIGESLEQEL